MRDEALHRSGSLLTPPEFLFCVFKLVVLADAHSSDRLHIAPPGLYKTFFSPTYEDVLPKTSKRTVRCKVGEVSLEANSTIIQVEAVQNP